jgi:hypothetical protein
MNQMSVREAIATVSSFVDAMASWEQLGHRALERSAGAKLDDELRYTQQWLLCCILELWAWPDRVNNTRVANPCQSGLPVYSPRVDLRDVVQPTSDRVLVEVAAAGAGMPRMRFLVRRKQGEWKIARRELRGERARWQRAVL